MKKETYHHPHLRQTLIENGILLIAEVGVDAFSLRSLAARCGVSHAAPYKHFKNKDELIVAITQHVAEQFGGHLQAVLDAMPDASPKERILELGKQYIDYMINHPTYYQVFFFNPCGSIDIQQIPTASPDSEKYPWGIFQKTAFAYLDSIGTAEDDYIKHTIKMWAVVHGLSALLINKNVILGDLYADYVDSILNSITTSTNNTIPTPPNKF